jgi:hypothetical protein
MYQTDLDRHLFATASFRPEPKRKDREDLRGWLRIRWANRSARWKAAESNAST